MSRSASPTPKLLCEIALDEPSVSNTTAAIPSRSPCPLARTAWRSSPSDTRLTRNACSSIWPLCTRGVGADFAKRQFPRTRRI